MKHVETARISALVAAIGILGSVVAAQARPDVRTMGCAQAQSLIESRGAVVLTTGQHTYDRFVSGSTICPIPNVPRLTYVQTRDNPQCPVGYTCVQQTDDGGMGIIDH